MSYFPTVLIIEDGIEIGRTEGFNENIFERIKELMKWGAIVIQQLIEWQ